MGQVLKIKMNNLKEPENNTMYFVPFMSTVVSLAEP